MTDDKEGPRIVEFKPRTSLHNEATVRLLREWLAQAENGELVTVALIGLCADGASQSAASSSEDCQRLLGAMEIWKFRMLGEYVAADPTRPA